MTEQEQLQLAEREAARLAALAAEPAIAAGAADDEVGPAALAGHLPNEVAVAHRMMMQLAAISAAVLDWPFGPPGLSGSGERTDADVALDTTPAALAAARLAGAACRQMEQVRQCLPALSVPLAGDGHWQALAWAGEVCSEAELARRFEAARAAARDIRPVHGASASARAVEAAARASAVLLAAEAGAEHLACAIAAIPGKFPRRIFAHELAAGHGLYMRLGGRFDAALAHAAARRHEPVGALRLANASARIFARLRRGRATLASVMGPSSTSPSGGGGRRPTLAPRSFWGGADGGYIAPGPESVPTAAAGHGVPSPISGNRAAALSLSSPARHDAAEGGERQRTGGGKATANWKKSLAPGRRGRLNNGNAAGDFLAAARCGARTRRATCCLQPAMKNGRCRLHGGKSTGPRTLEGRARAATARLNHGAYRAEVIALQRAASHHLRRLRDLLSVGATPSTSTPRNPTFASHRQPRAGGIAAAETASASIGVHRRSSAVESFRSRWAWGRSDVFVGPRRRDKTPVPQR